ncbi:MAG: adenylate/guanylate cyclase domain-containing protein [Hyphomicrobiales bacterium]|nr:adenylate/guanylate cyclase domain-containing protein [Hyphomicrobiales bacterium]
MASVNAQRTVTMTFSLAASFGLVVLIGVGIVLAIQLYAATTNTFELARKSGVLTSELIVDGLEDHFAHVEELVLHAAKNIGNGTVGPENPDDLARYLQGAMAGMPQIHALGFIDTDLQIIGAERPVHEEAEGEGHGDVDEHEAEASNGETHAGEAGAHEGAEHDDTISPYREDHRRDAETRKALFAAAEISGAEWIGISWHPRYRETVITLRGPVRRDGVFIGAIVAWVGIDEISHHLEAINRLLDTTAFILYGHEAVLAHDDIDKNHEGIGPARPLPLLKGFSDPVLAAMWRKEGRTASPIAMPAPLKSHAVEVDGESYAFLYRELDGYGEVPWVVGTYVDMESVSHALHRLMWAAALGLLVLAAAIAAAVMLGRRIAVPVRRIAAAAEQIGDLQLEDVPNLPGSRITELNQQAHAFNAMVAGLRWFDNYVPKALVRRLLNQAGSGGIAHEDRQVTVLFTDIVGFSSLSEHEPAAAVAEFLNDHFRIVVGCIEANGGTVDKFIGDSVMAFWGAPEKHEHQAEAACTAAAEIAAAVKANNAERRAAGKPSVAVRIGIHSGLATVGNIGSPERINYTLVGDMVNVASRVEQLGRELVRDPRDATVLISGTTRAGLSGRFQPKSLGKHPVKGREAEIEIYDLLPETTANGVSAGRPTEM